MNGLVQVKPRSRKVLFDSKYEKIGVLGCGNFGKVFLVQERWTQKRYAAKVVDTRLFKTGDQRLYAEKKICEIFTKRLSHKNIVQIHQVLHEREFIYIIMEHIDGEELFSKIKQNQKISESQARIWFHELIEAVQYIHDNKIVHRDLKPENVLINKNSQVKICDFGFAKSLRHQNDILSTHCGSPYYAAPEMVTARPYEGPPVDMWSCGVILYVMMTGTLPFQAGQMSELVQKIKIGHYPKPRLASRHLIDLLDKLLCVDARHRITAKECLEHPWMTENAKPLTMRTSVSANTMNQGHQKADENTLRNIKRYHSNPMISQKQSSFLSRVFKRRVQVAPLEVATVDKKVPQVVLNKFKGLFRKSPVSF